MTAEGLVAPLAFAIRDSGFAVYIATSGAGAGLQHMLWDVPGISRALVGAAFPYEPAEVDDFTGCGRDRYCTQMVAVELACAAYVRAKARSFRSGDFAAPAVGLGLTASVASLEPHRGEHRIHAATVGNHGYTIVSQTLEKGQGVAARMADGYTADVLGLRLLAHAVGAYPWSDNAPTGAVHLAEDVFWQRPLFCPDGRRGTPTDLNDRLRHAPAFLPGSFNPFHTGHRAMASSTEHDTRRPVVYLVNADNPHKPSLGVVDMLSRVANVHTDAPEQRRAILFTRGQPLFVDKVQAFQRQTFVMGADTLERMLDPQWGVSPETVLRAIVASECTIRVYSREVDGRHLTAASVLSALPFDARPWAHPFLGCVGNWPESSTAIRRR